MVNPGGSLIACSASSARLQAGNPKSKQKERSIETSREVRDEVGYVGKRRALRVTLHSRIYNESSCYSANGGRVKSHANFPKSPQSLTDAYSLHRQKRVLPYR